VQYDAATAAATYVHVQIVFKLWKYKENVLPTPVVIYSVCIYNGYPPPQI
jgi:hypothetical protein